MQKEESFLKGESPSVLVDSHGREVHYLRISVTDRCNLCCRYCRDEKTPFMPHSDILTYEEIEDIIAVAVDMGVHKLRFTGGEPFARAGFLGFLRRIHERFPSVGLKLTSNGTLLGDALEELKEQKRNFDYVFFSPVFDSISKQDYRANYSPEELRKAHKAGIIDKKVMALGGIDVDNVREVKSLGFGGVAIMGALWSKFDSCLDQDFDQVIEHFKKLKKLID